MMDKNPFRNVNVMTSGTDGRVENCLLLMNA